MSKVNSVLKYVTKTIKCCQNSFLDVLIDANNNNNYFGLLSLSLLLFPRRFGRYVLRPSGVCRTREPSLNFELRPLLKPRGSPVLIPLVKCSVFLYCYSSAVRIEPAIAT